MLIENHNSKYTRSFKTKEGLQKSRYYENLKHIRHLIVIRDDGRFTALFIPNKTNGELMEVIHSKANFVALG